MGETLENFIQRMQIELIRFQQEYIKNHKAEPRLYPLKMKKHYEPLWLDFFLDHCKFAAKVNSQILGKKGEK